MSQEEDFLEDLEIWKQIEEESKKSKPYEPELGQLAWGQPHQELECTWYVESILEAIETRFVLRFGDDDNPFRNTGSSYENKVFEVYAYSWNEEVPQTYNFRWNGHEFFVSWYKYLGRGMSQNREMSLEEAAKMMDECLDSLR